MDASASSLKASLPRSTAAAFPAKRTVGDQVRVEADIFTDGHDAIAASLLAHREGRRMDRDPDAAAGQRPLDCFLPRQRLGRYGFKVQGWVDHFETWHRDLLKRIAAESDAAVDYLIGADLVAAAAEPRDWRRCKMAAEARRDSARQKEPKELRTIATDRVA
jgi:starch synthase (maltosyl-transferring)